ncbi:hypothetical protein [Leisingera sp.]|nr:hypothetical protein [Leisingera sp.]
MTFFQGWAGSGFATAADEWFSSMPFFARRCLNMLADKLSGKT